MAAGNHAADAGAPPDASIPSGSLIDGRYRVEAALAHGGMGAVYRVHDTVTDQPLALKRLLMDAADSSALAAFEREFHTLKRLQHPSIIEVYDYGTDARGPYYTMELLDGADLRDLAPVDYRSACAYLRDIAASIALLHARRLVHRDISPRNIRVTSDGRCKLLDFGALIGFGTAPNVVGTPSCMAPEALHSAPLDPRTDIYSLGAVAYWLLTGRQAYPAKDLRQLLDLFQRAPPRPSTWQKRGALPESLSPIPPALDALVMSMLAQDPQGRPTSSAVIIERLTVIGELEPLRDAALASSYLENVELVARRFELARVQEVLERLQQDQRGGTVLISGDTGVGKSRLLHEALLSAQFAGVTLIQGHATSEPEGLARQLAQRLLDRMGDVAIEKARPHADVLVGFLPTLREDLGADTISLRRDGATGEWRMRVQAALEQWFAEVSRVRPLLVAVDDLHRADAFSAGFIATLSHASASAPLAVLATADRSHQGSASAAVELTAASSQHVELSPLSHDDSETLVRGLFGDVPNLTRTADRLFGLTRGNPLHMLELARHLIERQVVRYQEGAWLLPTEIEREEVPSDLEALWSLRAANLAPGVRTLGAALALLTRPAPRSLCAALHQALMSQRLSFTGDLDGHEEDEGFAASMATLLSDGLLRLTDDGYLVSHDAWRRALDDELDAITREHAHRICAAQRLAHDPSDPINQLDAGWHLLRAGDEARGAQLLADAGNALAYASDDMDVAMPAFEAALHVYERQGRSDYERLALLLPLCMGGYTTDRAYAQRHGDAALALGRRVTGLDLADRLRPWLGRLGVFMGMGLALLRYWRTPRARRPWTFREYVVAAVSIVTALAGTAVLERDIAKARALARSVESLRALGKRHSATAMHDFVLCLARTVDGHEAEALAGWRALLARLEDPNDLQDVKEGARLLALGGSLFASGVLESYRDDAGALRHAEKLESKHLRYFDLIAAQLRTLYHANRGELEQAFQWLERVELHAVQRGSAWQVEIWSPNSLGAAYARCDDLLHTKQAMVQWQGVVDQVPTLLSSHLVLVARYHMLRGDIATAIATFEEASEARRPRNNIGWAMSEASFAQALIRNREFARARDLMQACIAELREPDHDFPHLYLQPYIELALAHAGLGAWDAATAQLEALLDRHREAQAPLILGLIHEAWARVALAAHDRAAFADHLSEAEGCFKAAGSTTLGARCRALAEEARIAFGGTSLLPDAWTGIFNEIARCTDPAQRAQRILDVLVRESDARSGMLYLIRDGLPGLVAPAGKLEDPRVRALVEETLGALATDDETTLVEEAQDPATALLTEASCTQSELVHRVVPLWASREGNLAAVGAVVLGTGDGAPLRLPHTLIRHAGEALIA